MTSLLQDKAWWNGPFLIANFDVEKQPPFASRDIHMHAAQVADAKPSVPTTTYPFDPSRFPVSKSVAITAETEWVKRVQKKSYGDEIKLLGKGRPIHKESTIVCFDPFIDVKGVLRVGGRISVSSMNTP